MTANRKRTAVAGKARLYPEAEAAALPWKQCTLGMRSKLQARPESAKIEKDCPIELLLAIKEHSMNYESSQHKMKIVVDAIKAFVTTRQSPNE